MYLPDTASVIAWRQHKYISLCIKLKGKIKKSTLAPEVQLLYISEFFFFLTKLVQIDLNNLVLMKKQKNKTKQYIKWFAGLSWFHLV